MLSDDFDYPMPQRATNWTLSNTKQSRRLPAREVNRTADIDGATAGTTAHFRSKKFQHKPDLFAVADITGAAPKQHCQKTINKTNIFNVSNRDIEHSYPESKLFATPRLVNPLEPVYPLATVHNRLPTPPIFRRETMKTSDIDGTHAKPHRERKHPVNPLDYTDVPLSSASMVALSRQPKRATSMALVTHDINHPSHADIPNPRGTNPLDPVYRLARPAKAPKGDSGDWTVGPVAGAKPRQPPHARSAEAAAFALSCNDIAGAQPGNRLPYPKERREWKQTNNVSDIDIKGKRKLF
jgi:hypothetical protein